MTNWNYAVKFGYEKGEEFAWFITKDDAQTFKTLISLTERDALFEIVDTEGNEIE